MLVTDMDGTLLDSSGRLAAAERRTLESLGEMDVIRVIATGRNLHSADRVIDAGFPIDYLVFASGAGIMEWPSRRLILRTSMQPEQVVRATALLIEHSLDFMLHHAVPENHRFRYFRNGCVNPDFERRREVYRDFAEAWSAGCEHTLEVSQLLAIVPDDGEAVHQRLTAALCPLNVIRTTSPLDGVSTWIEIFPERVSKASASAWLAARHGIEREAVVAVGNDWNDVDLLQWAGCSFVVGNAVDGLRARHPTVAANDHGGVSEAVRRWLADSA